MRFDKWQALGNDYMLIEQDKLPFMLTPARVRALCAPHSGVAADGIVLLCAPERPEAAAQLRIFNPDGSEAEVSGNGTREAVLYMRRSGWASTDTFTVDTAAGELRPTITSPTTCTVDMGHARVRSEDFPSGGQDGRGELLADGTSWTFQHVQVGNPQCVIRMDNEQTLSSLDLSRIGPEIERHELFPNRTNVSWYTPLHRGRIRARIFERGVGETSASGTGAVGAATAFVLDGGDSPVTVVLDGGELQITVQEGLRVVLSGWAAPVFKGELAEEFVEELRELD
ncbi:MAG TPA: diaminopimelate epimerase [Solirubrobacteraceae bacterium]|nr:diaminopimelate epimerase [Solirubrobacteraceae bacterium]